MAPAKLHTTSSSNFQPQGVSIMNCPVISSKYARTLPPKPSKAPPTPNDIFIATAPYESFSDTPNSLPTIPLSHTSYLFETHEPVVQSPNPHTARQPAGRRGKSAKRRSPPILPPMPTKSPPEPLPMKNRRYQSTTQAVAKAATSTLSSIFDDVSSAPSTKVTVPSTESHQTRDTIPDAVITTEEPKEIPDAQGTIRPPSPVRAKRWTLRRIIPPMKNPYSRLRAFTTSSLPAISPAQTPPRLRSMSAVERRSTLTRLVTPVSTLF